MILFMDYVTETYRRQIYINQNWKSGETQGIIYLKQLDISFWISSHATIFNHTYPSHGMNMSH
jgi:hypothetical protein